MNEWRHNDAECQWEYGYFDLARDKFIWWAMVTDEHIDRVMWPERQAARLYARVGSLPPPWKHYEPDPPPPVTISYGGMPI